MILYISGATTKSKGYIPGILKETFPEETVKTVWLLPPINTSRYYNNVRSILEESEEEIVVFAHSMGAFMILSLYNEFKDKIISMQLINPLIDIDKKYWTCSGDIVSDIEYQNLQSLPQPVSLMDNTTILPVVIYQSKYDERIDSERNLQFSIITKSKYININCLHRFTPDVFENIVVEAEKYILLPTLKLNIL